MGNFTDWRKYAIHLDEQLRFIRKERNSMRPSPEVMFLDNNRMGMNRIFRDEPHEFNNLIGNYNVHTLAQQEDIISKLQNDHPIRDGKIDVLPINFDTPGAPTQKVEVLPMNPSSNTMRRLQQKKFDMKKYIFFKRRHRRHLYRRRLYTVQLVERTTFLSSCDETLEGKGENYNGCQNKSISG